MPTYLIHGFRWPRGAIRIHVILNNIDEAAPEWLIRPSTTVALLENFIELWPDTMEDLPNLRFIEQHDPRDEVTKSQPYAYVADVVEEITLSVDVDEVRGRGVPNDQWASMMDLRDKLCKDAKVAWYVVVCGDEERHVPLERAIAEREEYDEEDETSAEESQKVSSRPALKSTGSRSFFGSSSKSSGRPKTPPLQEQKSHSSSSRTTTSSRPKTPNDLRSSTRTASPTMTRTTSRTATLDQRDRPRDRDRDHEQKRVRFDSACPDYIHDTETDEQQRSSSIGRWGRKVLGMKESKSKSNLRDEVRDTPPTPPMPHRHKPRKP